MKYKTMKQSPFFDFFNSHREVTFHDLQKTGIEDTDYIRWNEFLLPLDYGDSEAEYWAIRRECGLFDVSPIRKIAIKGKSAGYLLDHVLTRSVSNSPAMRGIYVAYCNEDGSMKDDSILYKYAEDDYLLMPSDIDHSEHLRSFFDQLDINNDEVHIAECTDSLSGVAFQGPLSAFVLSSMGFETIEELAPFEVRDYEVSQSVFRVARMGFTADLGYEVWFDPADTSLLQELIKQTRKVTDLTIPGYGLTALEACRLEGAFIVAGWDFATEVDPEPGFNRSPFEVGLGWLVNLDGEKFFGKKALLAEQKDGQKFTLRQFKTDSRSQIPDRTVVYSLIDGQKRSIGLVNCSAWSWGENQTIGNLSIHTEYIECASAWIIIDEHQTPIEIVRGSFVNFTHRNKTPAVLLAK
jgi:aminomethyltransferase